MALHQGLKISLDNSTICELAPTIMHDLGANFCPHIEVRVLDGNPALAKT